MFLQFRYDTFLLKNILLTFIKVIVTLLKALPKSVSCYENAFCFEKVS